MKLINTVFPAALALAILAACQAAPAVSPAAGGPSPQSALKTIAVGKTPHGMGAAGGFVYNSNIADKTISVVDAATDTVAETLTLAAGGVPGYVKAFHDEKAIMVTDTQNGALLVYEPASRKLLQTVPVGKGPDKIVVDEDDRTVYVSLTGENKLVALKFADDRSQAPARRELPAGTPSGEHRAIGLGGGFAAVPDVGDNATSLFNVATGERTVLTGGNAPGPVAIALTDETPLSVVVGNTASNTLSLFPLPSGEAKTLTDVGLTPNDSAVDPGLGRVYVTMAGSNEVAVVDAAAGSLVGKVPTGARPVHIYMAPSLAAADGGNTEPPAYRLSHAGHELSHELWVGCDTGNVVTVFDGATLAVKATVALGQGHHKMAFTNGKAYLSNITDGTITVIDRATIR